MSRVNELLTKLGFDKREAQIYVYLLKNIESTAYRIGKELNIERPTVYSKLDNLKERGLMTSFKKNNVLHYTPESLRTLEEKVEEQNRALEEVSPLLKEMISLANIHTPKIRMYRGKEGAKRVWEFILETIEKDKILSNYATTHSALFNQFPKYFHEWIERRRKLPVHVYLLNPESERKNIGWEPKTEYEHVRFLPDGFLFEGEIVTFGKYTGFFTYKEPNSQSIIIESKEITEMIERLLRFAWSMAKE